MLNDKIYIIKTSEGQFAAATTNKHKAFELLKQTRQDCNDRHAQLLQYVDGEIYYKE